MDCAYAPEPPTVLYLNSKESTAYFPENVPSDFSNYLPTPITIEPGAYEVALAEIFFTPKKQEMRYFKTENHKIKISKIGDIEKEVTVTKESDDVNDWLLSANMELETENFGVELLEEILDYGSHIIVMNKTADKIFELPQDVAYAFGFFRRRFEPGEHKSDSTVNTQSFGNLDTDIKLSLRPESETKLVNIPEPEDYSVSHLIQTINEALSGATTGVSVSIGRWGTRVLSTDPEVGIEFPSEVRKTLGFKKVIFTHGKEYFQPTILHWEPAPTMLCVSCDIIHPTSFGSRTTSWLRVIDQSTDYNKVKHLTFNPRSYHPITRNCFQTIHIRITDEAGRQFDFGNEAVTLTLAFRRKYESR